MISHKKWKRKISRSEFPKGWLCPTCEEGTLLHNARTIYNIETQRSKDAKGHEDWWVDWIEGRFFGTLLCSNSKCNEEVVYCGYTRTEEDLDEDGMPIGLEYFFPISFYPPLNIFVLPESLTPEVRKEVERSFMLFWSDIPACATSIRSAVELILDYKKIPRKFKDKKNKFQNLSLHKRIERLSKIDIKLKQYLLALKWIGNSGAHENVLTETDLIEGYEMLEKVIESIFDKTELRLLKTAKVINKTKKPKSRLKK